MSRKILFRGKQVRNGEWVYGDLTQNPNIAIFENRGLRGENDVIPETVGQFTGLIDKNGKMIFEGDVVEFLDNDILSGNEIKASGIVSFGDGEFIIDQIDGVKESYCNSFYEPDGRGFSWNELEIIGNIFDNPELAVKND